MKNLVSLPALPRFARHLVLGVATSFIATVLPAQTATDTPPPAPTMVAAPVDAGGTPGDQNNNGNNRRANFNPVEMQARMLAALRTQLDVPDDAEWALISERVTKVFAMRRNQLISGFAGGRLGGRFGGPADPEQDALRAAITDKLPDAEIKARLARLRDARKQNEAKLDQ